MIIHTNDSNTSNSAYDCSSIDFGPRNIVVYANKGGMSKGPKWAHFWDTSDDTKMKHPEDDDELLTAKSTSPTPVHPIRCIGMGLGGETN